MGRARKGFSRAALFLLPLAAAGPGPEAAEQFEPLTLFQKTARASLVVHVRAASDSTRRPRMHVLDIYKGEFDGDTLFIVPYVGEYSNPKPWLHREVFREDEEYFLFLDPYVPDRDELAFENEGESERPAGRDDFFVVLNASHGVVPIPAEGREAISSALKTFAEILETKQYDVQARRFRALLRERNPSLVEAGLDQIARFRLGTENEVSPLLNLLSSRNPGFRTGSLRILGQIGRDARQSGRTLKKHRAILDAIADRARNDEMPSARVEAVRALRHLGGPESRAILRDVSRLDEDQAVRYEAEIGLVELEGGVEPP